MHADAPAPGFLRRLAAGFYDLLIVVGVLMSTSFLVVVARGGSAVPAGSPAYRGFLVLQVTAYFIGFWTVGQTPGMRAWRLRLETLRGGPPSLPVATARFFAAILAAAPAGIGFLWMLVDSQRMTWHDRLTGTRVVGTNTQTA